MIQQVYRDPFIDLVSADPDLLRAEFDAIMAAEFPVREVPPVRRSHAAERPGRGTGIPPVAGRPTSVSSSSRCHEVPTRARERSPPGTTSPS